MATPAKVPKKDRQEMYVPRDQELLARLIHAIDVDKNLFSARRDGSTCETKAV